MKQIAYELKVRVSYDVNQPDIETLMDEINAYATCVVTDVKLLDSEQKGQDYLNAIGGGIDE